MVGSGIRWRSSEVKAAAVALSSSRCAAARVWKWMGCVLQSIDIHARESVSCRIVVSWQVPDVRGELRNEVQIPGLPRGVLVQTGGESKRERLVV